MRSSAGKANLFWPLAMLALLTVGLVAAACLMLVREFDLTACQREETVVASGMIGRMNEVAHTMITEVVWDDAVRHLDNHFDPAWTRENIGTSFYQNDNTEHAFVLNAANAPIFAAHRGTVAPLALFDAFAADARSLTATVRAAEARRGPIRAAPAAGQMLSDTIQATSFVNANGAIYILSATLVAPDFGKALPHSVAPIVLTTTRLDADFIRSIADRFLLSNARLRVRGTPAGGGTAHVVLRNDRGVYVAMLDWSPQTPGRAMLRRLGPPMLGTLSLLAAGVVLFYRRARRMADELVTSEARATHLAYHDALTGLPNRVLFRDRLAHVLTQMRRDAQPVAVFCIDLDRFKDINDTFGHPVGDELIAAASRLMASECRGSDTVARLSGDEFAIIQPHARATDAAVLASRLLEALHAPIELSVGRVFIGASIGITILQDAAVEPAEALRQADLALYRAKDLGKGQFCFFEIEMDTAMRMRRALEEDLREALANGALHLAYQPQFNERDGMTGVEALLRWRHPERGDISPAFFVGVAEECGLIVDLGMFTLRRAFEDSKRWKNLTVAINISAKQLRMKDFVTRVMALVHDVGVDPRQFEFEITEGVLLGDDPETHAMLRRLRELGFALAFDDFGTGYSSLSYLQRYPINRIKIDRSFIANLGMEDEADAFITAIVKLAKALRLSVIAEGVETESQQERLAIAGCTDMQGFLFSKPVAADEIDRLYAAPPAGGAA